MMGAGRNCTKKTNRTIRVCVIGERSNEKGFFFLVFLFLRYLLLVSSSAKVSGQVGFKQKWWLPRASCWASPVNAVVVESVYVFVCDGHRCRVHLLCLV